MNRDRIIRGARHLTDTLGVVKWIMVGVCILTGIVWFVAVAESAETATATVVLLETAAITGGVAGAVVAWAVFGWLQGVLGCLVVMATPPVLRLTGSQPVTVSGSVASSESAQFWGPPVTGLEQGLEPSTR